MLDIFNKKHKQNKTYIFFTYFGEALSIAKKLQEEGEVVYVGMIEDINDTKLPDEEKEEEDPKEQELRMKSFKGMFNVLPAKKLLKALLDENKPEKYLVLADINVCWKYTGALKKKGFKGLLADQDDREMEVKRDLAKKFVEEHYSKLKVADYEEFDKVDDAIKFIEADKENLWVLKPKGEHGTTVVTKEDLEINHTSLIYSLNKERKEYEEGGIILEKQIKGIFEITPQLIAYDGDIVYYSMDIEMKPFGKRHTTPQTGCAGEINVKLNGDEKVLEYAFPDSIKAFVKDKSKNGLLYVWDASLYLNPETQDIYFGEFCPNRFGWDNIFVEIEQSGGSASEYFESILNKKNPLKAEFGFGLRIFNTSKTGPKDDELIIMPEDDSHVWLYSAYSKDGEVHSIGYEWDLAVITSASDDIHKGIKKLFEYEAKFDFKHSYSRDILDFYSTQENQDILRRYNEAVYRELINNRLFDNIR